jgi:hypothetical protein
MDKHDRKWMKKALRLDRPLAADEVVPVFDLELLHRGVRDSLLVAKLFRRPSRYLKGSSGAAR